MKGKSPYEILYSQPHTYLNLKTFGWLCFASTLKNDRSKLELRSRKSVFIGYKIGIKGYVLFDVKSKDIFISKNVIFYESIFPYNFSTHHSKNNDSLIHDDVNFLLEPINCSRSTKAHDPGYIVHVQDSDNTPEITHSDDSIS